MSSINNLGHDHQAYRIERDFVKDSEIHILSLQARFNNSYGTTLERSIDGMGKVNIIIDLFLVPEGELDRLFQKEWDMSLMLPELFVGYCNKLIAEFKPHLKERKNWPKTTMSPDFTYEDVYAWVEAWRNIILSNWANQSSSIDKTGKRIPGLRNALKYFRANYNDFLSYILQNTNW